MHASWSIALLASGLLGALALAADVHADPLNAAPRAHLDASGWKRVRGAITAEQDAVPRLAVDGDPETAWRPDPEAVDEAWITFDFTRPWTARPTWTRLSTRWNKAPTWFRWEVSDDGANWFAIATRHPQGISETTEAEVRGPFLRLVVPSEAGVGLAEVTLHAAPRRGRTLAPPTVAPTDNRVRLAWSAEGLHDLLEFRIWREWAAAGGGMPRSVLLGAAPVTVWTDVVEFPPEADTRFRWRVEALGFDGSVLAEATTGFHSFAARSPAPFALRGVVEGYYGPRYPDAAREDFVRFVGNQGGNFYLYAPKLDPYHRAEWRTPYPPERLAHFAQLTTLGREHGVDFAWSLSPGVDYDPASNADRAAVLAKFRAMQQATGMRWFGLLMDDISVAIDATTATQQAALANDVLAALRENDLEARLLFVPTVYHGQPDGFSVSKRQYLGALSTLDASIPVVWTGPGIFSESIARADVAPAAALVGRPLLLWDNFPANDLIYTRRLFLNPLTGRDADLADPAVVSGLLANPMWAPAANRLPVGSVLRWLRDPEAYAESTAGSATVPPEWTADGLPPEMREWVRLFDVRALPEAVTTAAEAIPLAALEAWRDGHWPAPDLLEQAALLYVAPTLLRRIPRADLAAELHPFAHKGSLLGEALLAAWVELEHSARSGGGDVASAAAPLVAAARAHEWVLNEGGIETVLDFVLANPPALAPQGPAVSATVPQLASAGDAVDLVFTGGRKVRLFGLPGAEGDPATGRFRWTPDRPGAERWVAVVDGDTGTTVRYGLIRVAGPSSAGAGCACESSPPGDGAAVALLMALMLARRRPARRFRAG